MKMWKKCLIWLMCMTLVLPSASTVVYASEVESAEEVAEPIEVAKLVEPIELETTVKGDAVYEAEVSKILSGVNSSWSDLEKALYLNDYLAENCQYDLTYSRYSAYDIIVYKTGVCQAYAEAYKDLANRIGLSCEMVISFSLNHAWNIVLIDGQYYHVDVTWNDPIQDMLGRARHQYFLKSTAYFKSGVGGHLVAEDWFATGGVDLNSVTSTKYDDYVWNTVDVAFKYYNGSWYSLDKNQKAVIRYEYNGKKLAKKEKVLTFDFKWYLHGSTNSYWGGYYGGFGLFEKKLYYASPTEIYSYNLKTKKTEVVHKLTKKEKQLGSIYGMRISPDGVISYILSTEPNKGGTIKTLKVLSEAEISKITYKIQFVGNGSTSGKMSTITCKGNVTKKLTANKFKRKGYTFAGWNTKKNGSGEAYKNKAKVKNLTIKDGQTVKLYAQWKKVKYKVTYKLNGGKNSKNNPKTYYVTTATTILEKPTREGYVFKGWYRDSAYKKKVTRIKKGSTGNITFYAKWAPIKYEIVFDGNGATSGEMKSMSKLEFDKVYTLNANVFEREGYTFTGWNTEADGSGEFYADQAEIENLTTENGKSVILFAQWEENYEEDGEGDIEFILEY